MQTMSLLESLQPESTASHQLTSAMSHFDRDMVKRSISNSFGVLVCFMLDYTSGALVMAIDLRYDG